MPFGIGIWEVVILLAVLAGLFGAKGLPDVARRLGVGMREVRDAVADVDPRRMLDAPERPRPGQEAPRTPRPPEQRPSRDDV